MRNSNGHNHGRKRRPFVAAGGLAVAIKRQVELRTAARIQTLEVEVVGNHVVIRGRATSYHLKQLAIQGVVDVLGSVSTFLIDIDVQVTAHPPKPEMEFF